MESAKRFYYHGLKFDVSAEVASYAVELKANIELQLQAENEFRKRYNQYGSMDTAISKIPADLEDIFLEVVQTYVDRIVDRGFYEVNAESFLRDYYTEEDQVQDAFSKIEDAYSEIIMTQEQQKEWRKYKTANRGRWQGGGFGIGGAIKGAAMAGTANMISGAGHGIANAIGNMGSSIAASSKKSQLYKDKNTLSSLIDALRWDIFGILEAYVDFAEKRLGERYKKRYTSEVDQASNIMENVGRRHMGDDEFNQVVLKAFMIDPYNGEIYVSLLERYGDEEKALDPVADFFTSLGILKNAREKKLREIYENAKFQSLDDMKETLDKIRECAHTYGAGEDSPTLKAMEEDYAEAHKKYCTFDGVEYATVEDAETAKTEKEKLDHIMGTMDPNDEANMQAVKSQLESEPVSVYDKTPYIHKISEDIADFDRRQRTVQNVEYKTRDEANCAKQEAAQIEAYIKQFEDGTPDQIRACMEALKKVHYNYIDINPYLATLQKMLDEYDINVEWKKIAAMFNNRQFDEAIAYVDQNIQNQDDKKKIKERSKEFLKELLKQEIVDAGQYMDFPNFIVGCAFVLGIGYFISRWFSIAWKIAIGLEVLFIISWFMNLKTNAAKKGSYDLIKKLRKNGYLD